MAKLKEVLKVFKALSDSNRFKIVLLLFLRPHCVCELSSILGISQPTISRHLQILTEAGIVSPQKRGSFVFYELSPDRPLTQKILQLLKQEMEGLPELAELQKKTSPVSAFLLEAKIKIKEDE